jgi:hypothetical protein
VILRCLEKKKENRHQSAGDLLEDLSNIERGIPTMERVIPRSENKTDTDKAVTVSFKPRRVMVTGFLLIILLASVGLVWKVSRDMKRAPDMKGNVVMGGEESKAAIPTKSERRAVLREQIESQRESRAVPEKSITVELKPPEDVPLKVLGNLDLSRIIRFSENFFGEGVSEYQKAQGIMSVLRYGTSNILKLLSEEDVEKFIESVDKALESMDADEPFKEEWALVSADLKQWNQLRQTGDKKQAEYHYGSAINRLNRLLPQIQTKEFADRSRRDVGRAWHVTEPSRPEVDENILLGLANKTREDADRAYQARDFAKAGILYSLAGEVFTLNEDCEGDAECVLALRGLAVNRREKADRAGASKSLNLYREAQSLETRADGHLNSRDYREAADFFLKAAVLYEQAVLGTGPER